jgi:CO/xanthine dehydrogenase FAD-binding subunit
MLLEYHRPDTIEDAIALLNRKSPHTLPIGGGTSIDYSSTDFAIVDLQKLNLQYIRDEKDCVVIGATTSLETIQNYFSDSKGICTAIKIDASKNIQSQATLAGLIKSSGSRSAVLTTLLALGTKIFIQPGKKEISLDEFLLDKSKISNGTLITHISINHFKKLLFESVARSPLDLPVLCCCAVRTINDEIRISLGGFGKSPQLVVDGINDYPMNKEILVNSGDQWASKEYRSEVAMTLIKRFTNEIILDENN